MLKNRYTLTLLSGIFTTCACLANANKQLDCMVKPEMYIELSSPVDGVLDTLLVENSANVKKGQVLATLESSVEVARVKLAQQEAVVEHTFDSKKVELEFTERNKTRYKEMYAKESTAFYEADRANTDAALAKIALQKSLADKKMAELQLQLAIAQLEQKTIKSPITGIVVERYVMPGESVNGRAIMKLAQVNPLRVELVAPAELFGQVRKGMSAEIKPEKPANQHYRATVTSVDQLIDPASGSFKVRLALPNPDDKLVGGVNCVATFNLEQADASIAPERHTQVLVEEHVTPVDATASISTDNTEVISSVQSSPVSPVVGQPLMQISVASLLGLPVAEAIPSSTSIMAINTDACHDLGLFNCPEPLQNATPDSVTEPKLMLVSHETTETVSGYMVFHPAAATYIKSKANLAILKKHAKGIYMFNKGPLRGGISLGYTTDETEAKKLAQQFISKGFNVQIRPQHKYEPRYFAGLADIQAPKL